MAGKASKHTPEPWCVLDHGAADGAAQVVAAGREICFLSDLRIDSTRASHAERVANANRIAACVNACAGIADPERAVPALLAALRNAVQSLDTDGRTSAAASLNAYGRAAIAKATTAESEAANA